MKIIECRGKNGETGETIGESLKEEIKAHINNYPLKNGPEHSSRIHYFTETCERYLPGVMEQIKGIARGAGIPLDDIIFLNLPKNAIYAIFDEQECSNIVFSDGPDGPLWGKNNEGGIAEKAQRRPVCALKIFPESGIPVISFTFCGMIATGDMMNAEGLAIGHSSVGSKFTQSLYNVPVRLWAHAGMMKCHSSQDFIRHMTSLPVSGKGYSWLCIDRHGSMFSIEAACPLVQIRKPRNDDEGMNCVNCFQLPLLENLTNRNDAQLKNAWGRAGFITKAIVDGHRDVGHMKKILRHHGDFSICRHGGRDESYTEYSMIGIPEQGKVLFTDGFPCEEKYGEIKF